MKVIPFKKEHLDLLELQDIGDKDIPDKGDVEILESYPSLTLVEDGRIIATIGCLLYSNNVGLVWVIPSKYLKKQGLSFAKLIKKHVDTSFEVFSLKKMVAYCIDNPTRKSFLEWLGFNYVEQKGDQFWFEKKIG